MPLKTGTSDDTLYSNFKKEKAAGKDNAQAWAIAYSQRRKSKKRKKR